MGRARSDPPAGVSFLAGDRFHPAQCPPPMEDLDALPSPFLTGIFDNLDPASTQLVTIETNRGCPFRCAYCSWNHPQAYTAKLKLRLFSLKRVKAELEWAARRKTEKLFVADSNFGLIERDVEVARLIAETKRDYGYPQLVTINYAKNDHRHLIHIVDELDEVKALSHGGIISIQTRDPHTLETIGRHNIQTSKYDELKDIFEKKGFPLVVQLMLGLPGATAQSFMDDLRHYFDGPAEVEIFHTVLLPNSPMAEPAFRAEHKIEINENSAVISTKDMPGPVMSDMIMLGGLFDAVHNLGVLHLPLVYLKWEKGLDPIEILLDLIRDPEAKKCFPGLLEDGVLDATALGAAHFRNKQARAEYDWDGFHKNFGAWIEKKYGLAPDQNLEVIFQAQSALMPGPEDSFPRQVELPHDVRSWYAQGRNGRFQPLNNYPPATLHAAGSFYFWNKIARKNKLWKIGGTF